MTTRPYTELYGLVEALCGCTFATQEQTRVNHFINRRARKAYAESEFWSRFYVAGEEREVSDTGLLSDEQTGLSDIGTVLRIHATAPFLTRGSVEYADFHKTSSGTQITGYQANKSSADMVVTGTLSPDVTGVFELAGEFTSTGIGAVTTSIYSLDGGGAITQGVSSFTITPPETGEWAVISKSAFFGWTIYPYSDGAIVGASDYWVNPSSATSPDGLTLSPNGGSSVTGEVLISTQSATAFVTYKAALTTTYGTADGEESDFPGEWFDYTAHGAYSDWLRSEAQQDRAALAEAEANEILMQELEKIGRQGGSAAYTRVVNHGNTQYR